MNSEGVGLGLTIVKQVVEANHGQIQVYSEGIGYGTTFIISMKMNVVEEEEEDEEAEKPIEEELKELLNPLSTMPAVKNATNYFKIETFGSS